MLVARWTLFGKIELIKFQPFNSNSRIYYLSILFFLVQAKLSRSGYLYFHNFVWLINHGNLNPNTVVILKHEKNYHIILFWWKSSKVWLFRVYVQSDPYRIMKSNLDIETLFSHTFQMRIDEISAIFFAIFQNAETIEHKQLTFIIQHSIRSLSTNLGDFFGIHKNSPCVANFFRLWTCTTRFALWFLCWCCCSGCSWYWRRYTRCSWLCLLIAHVYSIVCFKYSL